MKNDLNLTLSDWILTFSSCGIIGGLFLVIADIWMGFIPMVGGLFGIILIMIGCCKQ